MKSIELKDIEEWVKPTEGVWCLVECWGYCPSGYAVAKWGREKWLTDVEDDITEYVTAYQEIDES